ncbi:hypothetical protein [Streptomyces sp. NPDC006510]|uniref:hypothetical protein n=1 Tax=Streptomyces sp. NPDC006510 TaxID=3155600 RepID=UPI0033A15622
MTQGPGWIDSLAPQDLTIEVPAGLTVRVQHPETWRDLDRPVVCPWCLTTRGLTLRTGVEDAVLRCLQGHAWTDRCVPTAMVSQLHVLAHRGGVRADTPFAIPRTVRGVWLWLLPDTDVPGTAGLPAPVTTGLLNVRRLGDLVVRDPAQPLLLRTALLAWGMLAWAVPHHATLVERLALPTGAGPAGRLVAMVLWQLLHDTATNASAPPETWMRTDLADLAARLNPDDKTTAPLRHQLRNPAPGIMGTLSEADAARLRECGTAEWADACALAHLTLLVHLHRTRIDQAYTAGLGQGPANLRPRLLDCPAVTPDGAHYPTGPRADSSTPPPPPPTR